jgi:hypothetical protein
VGTDRILVNSAGDWGKSNPLAVPDFIQEMKRRGHSQRAIQKVVFDNPLAFFRQSRRWSEPIDSSRESSPSGIKRPRRSLPHAQTTRI